MTVVPLADAVPPPDGTRLRRLPATARTERAEELAALTASSATAVIGPRRMRDLLRAAPDESTEVIVAEQEDRLLGYVHLSTGADVTWLVSGAVVPEHRRRGIGGALLQETMAAARSAGAESLRISGRPAGYAVPGIDRERDGGTAAFLERSGAQQGAPALSMTRPLLDLEPATARPGTTVRECRESDLPALLDLVAQELDPGWADVLHEAAGEQRGQQRILIAHGQDGDLLGFAGWGLVGRDPSRFGPFGVIPAARGRGAGAALLDAALRRMAGEGLAHAWFQWTAPGSPAHHLYASRGFTTLRTYTPYSLPLAGPLGDRTSPPAHQEGPLR
ncbi:hypothetical protein CFK41_06555 [Brachybacterium ginsengisoli]|uniref:N-acetyltransferase domain-containing protein n=1 Tax=Brachybacterium ginsengisoli TaxID=1331682 RepID=A0A291GW70_9MICO|nr:GNAT family N-acetyltransferase [Brachybacterium ginsengisoli]ATG54465.1 hypothetical protein CFK41_06555 [Brachybacterium ginsengisoli]